MGKERGFLTGEGGNEIRLEWLGVGERWKGGSGRLA